MAATAAPPGPLGKVDLVIWPETALPYLIEEFPNLPAQITAQAQGAAVATGLQRIAQSAEGTRGWNSLKVYGAQGQELAAYDKHHLVPFGEYIPLGDLAYNWFGLRAFAAQTGAAYTAGPGPQVLDLGAKLGKVLPLICYEVVFPQDLRVTERADWILQITNDAWFGTFSGPFQHAAQAQLRAIEQGLPLVRVANTGVTEVIDARGRITAQLPFGASGFLDASLPGALSAPPYALWGETPALLLLAGCFLWAMRKPKSRKA
jgi:apolipoprotein N-acyltransferase